MCRTYSSHSPKPPHPEVKPPSTLRAYVVRKYVEYITRFDATFERSYPKIYKVYRLFKDGNDCGHILVHVFSLQGHNSVYVSLHLSFFLFFFTLIIKTLKALEKASVVIAPVL